MYHKNQPNVGRVNIPYMDGMGYFKTYFSCWHYKGLSLGAYSKKVIKTLNFGLVADFRDDKLSGSFSPTHLKNMFVKLDGFPPSGSR